MVNAIKKLPRTTFKARKALKLPLRPVGTPSEYDAIEIISDGRLHESNYELMILVGTKFDGSREIINSGADVIEWQHPEPASSTQSMMTEMHSQGVINMWSSGCKFVVEGPSYLSTQTIIVQPKNTPINKYTTPPISPEQGAKFLQSLIAETSPKTP